MLKLMATNKEMIETIVNAFERERERNRRNAEEDGMIVNTYHRQQNGYIIYTRPITCIR